METISKEKIAEQIKEKLGFSKSFALDIVDNVFGEILKIIDSGKSLTITNFGKFGIAHKKERPGRNFINDAVVTVPAKTIVRFTASLSLKKKINSNMTNTKDNVD